MSENETLQFVAKRIKHHSNRVCNSYIRKDKKNKSKLLIVHMKLSEKQ